MNEENSIIERRSGLKGKTMSESGSIYGRGVARIESSENEAPETRNARRKSDTFQRRSSNNEHSTYRVTENRLEISQEGTTITSFSTGTDLSPGTRERNKLNKLNTSSSILTENSYNSVPSAILDETYTSQNVRGSTINGTNSINNGIVNDNFVALARLSSNKSHGSTLQSASLSTVASTVVNPNPNRASESRNNVTSRISPKGMENDANASASRVKTPSPPSSTLLTRPIKSNASPNNNDVPSTSSWNNSTEQESEYVVDPVHGNTYFKGQFLGKGGFGRVYLLTESSSGNQYACKIIPKNRMQKIHLQKIAREIMIHKKLTHVNVVQMYHYFEDNLHAYMLLEACPRKSLMHVLKYRGRITEPEARYYMKQMVNGVTYIHSQKVVHRDLKPGNMFLSEHMIVKIGDFGLATSPDGQRRRVTICGTPNYIAPEVLYKQAYSYEADVWALGCILYALLVGQPPFESSQLKETYARICNNQYKEVSDSIASQNGRDLIHWLLQPTPKSRPTLDRVKDHAYLTKEYVPATLPPTCCYQMPPPHVIVPPVTTPNPPGENLARSVSAMTIPAKSSLAKEAKVNWIVKKLPRISRFKQRLGNILCPDNRKGEVVVQSTQMHKALEVCIAEMTCPCNAENPPTVSDVMPLFVTKWIDYSNKYGLGFELSDRSVGVLFNDSTKMSYTHDRRRIEYMTTDNEITRYNREKEVPIPLQKKLDLLRYFTRYMEDYLTEGGEIRETRESRQTKGSVPRMKRWLRTDKAIVMELTIPLLQVNFFRDHTKMVVSRETQGYLVTYIDASRQTAYYWLKDLCEFGCTADLYERLHYVYKVSREFADMDQMNV